MILTPRQEEDIRRLVEDPSQDHRSIGLAVGVPYRSMDMCLRQLGLRERFGATRTERHRHFYERRAIEELREHYVRRCLERLGCPREAVTPQLLEAKRLQILIERRTVPNPEGRKRR